jgi:HAT1-interacting factor 1
MCGCCVQTAVDVFQTAGDAFLTREGCKVAMARILIADPCRYQASRSPVAHISYIILYLSTPIPIDPTISTTIQRHLSVLSVSLFSLVDPARMTEQNELLDALPEETLTAEELFNSVKVSLADLCAKGTAQYAHKNYEEAADLYARASELQAELNGEMSPENAEILFLYGRSLFKVGQGKSDVLGNRAGGEKKKPNSITKTKKEEQKQPDRVAEEGVAIIAEQNSGAAKADVANGKKPLFQFTGDENFEDSDEDEEVSSLPRAGYVGFLTRPRAKTEKARRRKKMILLLRLKSWILQESYLQRNLSSRKWEKGKGKKLAIHPPQDMIRSGWQTHMIFWQKSLWRMRGMLTASCFIAFVLTHSRFPAAVVDFRASVAINQSLFPEEHEAVAEAHYKLSLALEFASITRTQEEGEESTETGDETHLDQVMRDEAAKEMEAAITSVKIKLQNKEVELASSFSPDDNDIIIAQIKDAKEIIAEMEQRVSFCCLV